MDRPGMALDDPNCVCNLSSAQNDIPIVTEDPLNESTNLILIFDDQNGFASARRQGADRLHHLLRDTLDAREVDPERASLSRFTFDQEDRKSRRLNSSHSLTSRMPSSA